jgi:hypothetical protein
VSHPHAQKSGAFAPVSGQRGTTWSKVEGNINRAAIGAVSAEFLEDVFPDLVTGERALLILEAGANLPLGCGYRTVVHGSEDSHRGDAVETPGEP